MKQHSLVGAAHAIGDFIEYWGFKSIHGRVWALIYLSEQPISTPEIVEKLEVSKALVSIGINELIEHGLISPSEKVKFGAQTYVACANFASVVRGVLRERELELVNRADSQLMMLNSLSDEELNNVNVSRVKLQDLQQLNKLSREILSFVIRSELNSLKDWIKLFKEIVKFKAKKTSYDQFL